MNYLDLEDRLYTSTEVARILGVSLRSVYRYLEDGKLDAEIKTATGRHRFTKQNILEFLSPQASRKNLDSSNSVSVPRATARVEEVDEDDFQPIRSRQIPQEKLTPIVEDFEEDDDDLDDSVIGSYSNTKVDSSRIEEETTFTSVKADSTSSFESQVDDEFESETAAEEPIAPARKSHVEEEPEEEVDWLAKFRAAAEKYKAEVKAAEEEEVSYQKPVAEYTEHVTRKEAPEVVSQVSAISHEPIVEEKPRSRSNTYYYTSTVGGLKDIAQNLDKSAQKASLDYAFTMDAGLSLHKPIRPFSLIHSYVRSEDLPFFEKILGLRNADKEDAQLCLIASDDDEIFTSSKEMHGLKVVSNSQLKADLTSEGKADLAKEL